MKRGLNIPAVTIVDEAGLVIEEEQRRLFRHIVQNGFGADVIFGAGTTGEWNRLSNEQRQRVMKIEVDEVARINAELLNQGATRTVDAWVGVNGKTKAEILSNLDAAIQLKADAAVIAPLAIEDLKEEEIVSFFQREITDLLESSGSDLPVLLYDNADISAHGNVPHIRTRLVKDLSRLPWVRGIKVSAPRRVIGNYTKASLHYKLPGEFAIYIGNAMLIFEMYRPGHGLIGRLREGWRDFLLHDIPPIGVVSGPANVMPREWQKAWRACWSGDDAMTDLYRLICSDFESICGFDENGARVKKTIACLKYALKLDGVISEAIVCQGTKALTSDQEKLFAENYTAMKDNLRNRISSLWQTRPF